MSVSQTAAETVAETVEKTSNAGTMKEKAITTLHYPLEDQTSSGDRRYGAQVSFQLVKIDPAEISGLDKNLRDAVEKVTNAAAAVASDPDVSPSSVWDSVKETVGGKINELFGGSSDRASEVVATKQPEAATSEVSFKGRDDNPLDQYIKLYLPVSYSVRDSLTYGDVELGVSGAVALGAINSGKSAVGALAQGLMSGLKSLGDFASGAPTGDLASLAAVRVMSKAPTEIGSAVSIAAAVTVNPNKRAMFKGVNMREFQFQFKFLPKSKAEADMVEKIIKKFRYHAYPEAIEVAGDISLGFKYPELFNIEIKYYGRNVEGTDGVNVGTKMKYCYLRSVSTNYNPSTMAFHEDGKPVEIDVALDFMEERTLSRKDIEDGF